MDIVLFLLLDASIPIRRSNGYKFSSHILKLLYSLLLRASVQNSFRDVLIESFQVAFSLRSISLSERGRPLPSFIQL